MDAIYVNVNVKKLPSVIIDRIILIIGFVFISFLFLLLYLVCDKNATSLQAHNLVSGVTKSN